MIKQKYSFLKKIRNILLKLTVPLAKLISNISFYDKSVPRLTVLLDWSNIRPHLSHGYVLLSRAKGEFSNATIPGFWTHSSIAYGM